MGPEIKLHIWFALLGYSWSQMIPPPMGPNQMMSPIQGAGLPPGISMPQISLPPGLSQIPIMPMSSISGMPMPGRNNPGAPMPGPPSSPLMPGMSMPMQRPVPGPSMGMPGMPAPPFPPYPPYGVIPQGYYGMRPQQQYYGMEAEDSDTSDTNAEVETESEECRCSCRQCETQVARWCCKPVCDICLQQQQPPPGIHYLPYPYPMIITILQKPNTTQKHVMNARIEQTGNFTSENIGGLTEIVTDVPSDDQWLINDIAANISSLEKSINDPLDMNFNDAYKFKDVIVDDILKFSKQLETRLQNSYNQKKNKTVSLQKENYNPYNESTYLWPQRPKWKPVPNRVIESSIEQIDKRVRDKESTPIKIIKKIRFNVQPIPKKKRIATTPNEEEEEEIITTTTKPTKKRKYKKRKHKKIRTTTLGDDDIDDDDDDDDDIEFTTAVKCSKEHVTTPDEEDETTTSKKEQQTTTSEEKVKTTATVTTEPSTTTVKLTSIISTTVLTTTTTVPTTTTTTTIKTTTTPRTTTTQTTQITTTPLTTKTTTTRTTPRPTTRPTTTHPPTTHSPTTHSPTTHSPTTHSPTTHSPTKHCSTTRSPTTRPPITRPSTKCATTIRPLTTLRSTTHPLTSVTAVMKSLSEKIYIQKFRPVKSIKSLHPSLQDYHKKFTLPRGALKPKGKYMVTSVRRMNGDLGSKYDVMPIPEDMAEYLMSQLEKMKLFPGTSSKSNTYKSSPYSLDDRLRGIRDKSFPYSLDDRLREIRKQVPGLDIIRKINLPLLDNHEYSEPRIMPIKPWPTRSRHSRP